jgi:hypothetical protein
MEPRFMGCGELNPIAQTNASYEANRRVVLYVFPAENLPALPCQLGDTAPCQAQVGAGSEGSFRCAFYADIASRCSCEKPDPRPPSSASARAAARSGSPFTKDCPIVFAHKSGS